MGLFSALASVVVLTRGKASAASKRRSHIAEADANGLPHTIIAPVEEVLINGASSVRTHEVLTIDSPSAVDDGSGLRSIQEAMANRLAKKRAQQQEGALGGWPSDSQL